MQFRNNCSFSYCQFQQEEAEQNEKLKAIRRISESRLRLGKVFRRCSMFLFKPITNSTNNGSKQSHPVTTSNDLVSTSYDAEHVNSNAPFRNVEELVEQYRYAFEMFDQNRDGFITASEMYTVMSSLGLNPTTEETRSMIIQADADGNGEIDFSEFVCFLTGRQIPINEEQELSMIFQLFDQNGDGFISPQELKKAMENLGEDVSTKEINLMISAADSNGDGLINYDEFKRITTLQKNRVLFG
ncbi:Calmodulin [Trichinella nelsoni]|uniref:Calmodulin n=1 Tax=Trichinella nelsoni TaxID=6336 RepID=A0A0V0RL79_9BILA|nr:Calmodulin [Trichinella nelsoni]